LENPETKKNNVTLNEITMFQGRSFEAKKVIYISINDNLAQNPGIGGDDITIVLHEHSLENWSVKCSKPTNEVDFGFKITV
jgi:hypothetical protein